MTNYRKGYLREKKVEALLQDSAFGGGWATVSSRSSHGPADVWAAKDGCLLLIQVKRTKSKWAGFGPNERQELATMAKTAGGYAWLCWWPPHRDPEWIPEKEWIGS